MPHYKQGTHQLVVQIVGNYFKGIPVTESAGSGVECLSVRIVLGSRNYFSFMIANFILYPKGATLQIHITMINTILVLESSNTKISSIRVCTFCVLAFWKPRPVMLSIGK